MFIEMRCECLQEISQNVCMSNGVNVVDTVRFYYGNGPAAQFEAGHKQGGTYCCVSCGADSGRFSDIANHPLRNVKSLFLKAKRGKKEVHVVYHTVQ